MKRLAIVAVALAALVLAYNGYVTYRRVRADTLAGHDHLARAEAAVTTLTGRELDVGQITLACQELTAAWEDLGDAEAALGPFNWAFRLVGWVPRIGDEVQAARHLLRAAFHISAAGEAACSGAGPLLTLLAGHEGDLSAAGLGAAIERVITALEAGRSSFERSGGHLDQAASARQRIGPATTPQMNKALDQLDHQLPRLRRAIKLAIESPVLLKSLLGMEERKTYLVLSQNNAELRPTGGFVSSYAQVTVEGGEVVDFIYGEFPKAPEVKAEIEIPAWWARLERPAWVYWDTNWTADFPTAARQAEWFYEEGGNVAQPLDGVIAIDPAAAQMLLKALGPVYVPEYDVRADSENLLSLLEQYRAYIGEPSSEERRTPHKELLGEIARGLLEQMGQADLKQMLVVGQALGEALQQKHILLFFDDPELAALVAEQGWDGAISATTDDFLFVVDANMGRAKVDTQVEKTIRYEVIIGPGHSITSRATLDYYNGSSPAEVGPAHGWRGGTYWDYVRLYVPEGSLLAETKGNEYPTQITAEGDKTSFGNLFVVPVGERAQLSYIYVNAARIRQAGDGYVYRLTVQKQAGTLADELLITVTLPQGARLLAADPEPGSAQSNVVEYRSTLLTDQVFEITFR